MALPLRDVLAAIIREIDVASVRADINRAHWQQIYDESELLGEYSPSRIRVVEANLSLPLALEDVSDAKEEDYGITTRQIARVLPDRLPMSKRIECAKTIRIVLTSKKQNHLLSKSLKHNIRSIVEDEMHDIDPEELHLERINKIQQEYLSSPAEDREAKFVYKAKDLEKIDPEHIVRINFTLGVD